MKSFSFKNVIYTSILTFLFSISAVCQQTKFYISVSHSKSGNLTRYTSNKQRVFFVCNRPVISNDLQLFVPASFTSQTNNIEGLAICFGKTIQNKNNDVANGYCIIENAKPKILLKEEMSDNFKKSLISSKGSVFEQRILIKNKSIIPFLLFGNRKDFWRALAIFNDHFEIIENDLSSTMVEFQNALLKLDVIDAIYLDMGSWSHGSYLDVNSKIRHIGHLFTNTKKQTNWIVF